jgi:ATP-binding protein involved in chromosome partitioning
MAVVESDVLRVLETVQDPDLHRDIVSLGFIKGVTIREGQVGVTIELTTPACPVRDVMKEQAREAIAALPGVREVEVTMTSQVRRAAVTPGASPSPSLIPTVKHVIAVASGKGGVGKSTVSANLALALAATGAKVGLMDADVYGPSIPTILGITSQPEVDERNRITPVEHRGLKVVSMGFFMKPEEAVIWRGPMLHKTIQQFLGGVEWGDLDYLLCDLPPGTGDIQLSLCQTIPLTGAVIVSTPQDVALNVAQKAIAMFTKLNVPILGIIENMSGYACPQCGHQEDIFGRGGARQAAERLGIPFLGEIPLATAIRRTSDAGEPVVISALDSPEAKAFIAAAEQLAAQISIRAMQGTATGQVKVTF